MRGIIPPHITRTNYQTLKAEFDKNDVGEDIAERIWNTKILWLICMHPDDLIKLHIADLRSKYAFIGLDIVELRAIYYCLPKLWDGTRESRRHGRQVKEASENANCVQQEYSSEEQQLDNLAPKRQWKADLKGKLEELIRKEECETLQDFETRNPVYEVSNSLCSAVTIHQMFYYQNCTICNLFYINID